MNCGAIALTQRKRLCISSMTIRTILLTSFQTWLPHQDANSSDELLERIQRRTICHSSLLFLQQLPVDTAQASQQVIAAIQEQKPDVVICCGMAESRQQLTIESTAGCQEKQLKTTVNLEKLVSKLATTIISHDAGKFVCEGLYYEVLNYLQAHRSVCCIFVHVPILTRENELAIVSDFLNILEYLSKP